MKNKPYLAFDPTENKQIEGGWEVSREKTRTLYDGRYCAVAGIFFAVVDGWYSVLAQKRGEGTPDFQGYWCCPCGFLERDENSISGIIRETYEETGFKIHPSVIKFVEAETEPFYCNNGNVTLRHTGFLGEQQKICPEPKDRGGEKDEVAEIAWIPVVDIDRYNWAFGHGEVIKKYAAGKFKRLFLELLWG